MVSQVWKLRAGTRKVAEEQDSEVNRLCTKGCGGVQRGRENVNGKKVKQRGDKRFCQWSVSLSKGQEGGRLQENVTLNRLCTKGRGREAGRTLTERSHVKQREFMVSVLVVGKLKQEGGRLRKNETMNNVTGYNIGEEDKVK